MRFSKYFLKTSKTISEEDKFVSSKFLKQGGFIRESAAGRYYFLPIGYRVQQKIMHVIRKQLDDACCQEMLAPTLHPLELWKETNRTATTGFELMKVTDRRGAEFALGGTAEEMFVDLVRMFTISYKDMPFNLYQFSTKFRDEFRARGGLLRVREFIMKDGYSFHVDETEFKTEYEKMKVVYKNIFNTLGLDVDIVEADNGYIGGEYCHEFIVESDVGESKYFIDESSNYSAHEDIAVFDKGMKNFGEEPKELKEVTAKRGPTMEDGVELHKLPLWQQIKDVLFVDDLNRFVLAIIRGDYEVNETKLKNILGIATLRHATDEEIRDIVNSEPGFLSPVGIKKRIKPGFEIIIVADDSLRTVANSYGGGNKKFVDLLNLNIDRDYEADIEGDIALAKSGYKCVGNSSTLREKRGIEVGNIFQLGYHYSSRMTGAVYIDSDGKGKPFYMGCYGIGIGRTMAAIVEKHSDKFGIKWPALVSPFDVHLVGLDGALEEADRVYESIKAAGMDVLYDDRTKTAGEKFADADLIGIPIRLVVSKKTLQKESLELKIRGESSFKLVPLADLTNELKFMILGL